MHSTEVTAVTLEAIDRFRSWLTVRGKSPLTVKAYVTDMQQFLLATQTEIDQPITREEFPEMAAGWLTMYRRMVKPGTTARRKTSLRSFATWAGWGDILSEYDTPSASSSIPHPLPEGMEGVRLLATMARNERQQNLILLCGMVGCRVSEARAVRASHFNGRSLTIYGKGEKERVVPVGTEAWSYLSVAVVKSFANNDELLVNLKDRHARKVITDLGKRCSLQRPISSHDLRATFATAVYDKTRDIRLVQALLGHSSSKTTEIYLGINFAKMQEAVEL
jgi:site-specific recombinase XerD